MRGVLLDADMRKLRQSMFVMVLQLLALLRPCYCCLLTACFMFSGDS